MRDIKFLIVALCLGVLLFFASSSWISEYSGVGQAGNALKTVESSSSLGAQIFTTQAPVHTNKYVLTGSSIVYFSNNNEVLFQSRDYLQSSRMLTDSNGIKKSYGSNLPFGEPLDWQESTQSISRFKFTGKEQDNSQLMYFGARFLDPDTGRFLSVDLVPSMNKYSYVANNPLRMTDPSGAVGVVAVYPDHLAVGVRPPAPALPPQQLEWRQAPRMMAFNGPTIGPPPDYREMYDPTYHAAATAMREGVFEVLGAAALPLMAARIARLRHAFGSMSQLVRASESVGSSFTSTVWKYEGLAIKVSSASEIRLMENTRRALDILEPHGLSPGGGEIIREGHNIYNVRPYVEGTKLSLADYSNPNVQSAVERFITKIAKIESAEGVVFTDLKPANLVLTPGGEIDVIDAIVYTGDDITEEIALHGQFNIWDLQQKRVTELSHWLDSSGSLDSRMQSAHLEGLYGGN